MNKPYKTGLVVGKFCPLHQGHELLIEHALQQCEELLIISYTKPEFPCCPPALREHWIREIFPEANLLVIDDALLAKLCRRLDISDAPEIPHNDEPDDFHRQFVAWLCLSIFNKSIDAVFTSEEYGNGFADYLTAYFQKKLPVNIKVQHVCVDKPRAKIPVSGTLVRTSPHALRQFLSPVVYADFVERVCILGGESSGKTTLAKALAIRLETNWVAEYGRELWDRNNGALMVEDMLHIAHVQIQRENDLAKTSNQFLICDTSPLTTLLYSKSMFDIAAAELEALANRPYEHVFVCAADFDFVQDGTRRDENFRSYQHNWYLNELASRKINFVILEGSLDERLNRALDVLMTGHVLNGFARAHTKHALP